MGVVNYYIMPYEDTGDTTLSIKHNWTKGGVRRAVMRASLDTHLLSYLHLTVILFSSFSGSLSSSPSSSCELQAKFNLNRMYKDGDFVLGGVFPVRRPVYPESNFTSKPREPTCRG